MQIFKQPLRHSGARRLARARNPYSRSWLWIPGSRFARPGMTSGGILATRFARVSAIRCPARDERAQGKPGADCARRSRAPEHTGIPCAKHMGKHYRYRRDIPAFPAQWLYDLLRALPGEAAFLAPVAGGTYRRRSARVAAPGPHDFVVRCERFVWRTRLTPQRPSQPTPRFVTIAKRPSWWHGLRGM